jgi:hypothetical protein
MPEETSEKRERQPQDRAINQINQLICRACGSRFRTESELRDHQPYCSDPGLCLCHVDRIFYDT